MRVREAELEDEGIVQVEVDMSRRRRHGVSLKSVLLEDAMQVHLFGDHRATRAGLHR